MTTEPVLTDVVGSHRFAVVGGNRIVERRPLRRQAGMLQGQRVLTTTKAFCP